MEMEPFILRIESAVTEGRKRGLQKMESDRA